MKERPQTAVATKVYTHTDKVKFISDKIKHYKEIKHELTRLREEDGLDGTAEEVLNSLVAKWETNEANRGSEIL